MKIYVVLIHDRHTDTEVHAYTTPDAAIDFAREIAHERAHADHDEVIEENIEDRLYFATYCIEGDHVEVFETELNEVSA
jgi:hypothetical protein